MARIKKVRFNPNALWKGPYKLFKNTYRYLQWIRKNVNPVVNQITEQIVDDILPDVRMGRSR